MSDDCTACSASEQNVTSSLYDYSSVHDADTVSHVDYDANIVGWYVIFYFIFLNFI